MDWREITTLRRLLISTVLLLQLSFKSILAAQDEIPLVYFSGFRYNRLIDYRKIDRLIDYSIDQSIDKSIKILYSPQCSIQTINWAEKSVFIGTRWFMLVPFIDQINQVNRSIRSFDKINVIN